MAQLDNMAEGGKQQRVNTPPWMTDFVSSDCFPDPLGRFGVDNRTGFPGLVWSGKQRRSRGSEADRRQGIRGIR